MYIKQAFPSNTVSVDLGPSDNIAHWDPEAMPFNFVLVSRHPEWIIQKWGNLCSKKVDQLSERNKAGLPIRWYHKKLFNFYYDQYDKYGDYYRILDNSYGNIQTDMIREV